MQTEHRRGVTQSALMCTLNLYAPLEVVMYRVRAGSPCPTGLWQGMLAQPG